MDQIGLDDGPVVFVSHDRAQDEDARYIAGVMAQHGIRCCVAPADLPPGTSYEDATEAAIDGCDAVLVLFTSAADCSHQVASDLELAEDLDIPILLLRLEDGEPDELREWLGASEWVDWRDRRDDILVRIAERARRLADDGPTAEELLQAAVDHPMNVASRRNGLIIGVLAALLAIGGIAYGIWSGIAGQGDQTRSGAVEIAH